MTTFKIILVENDEDEQLFMREGFEKAGGFEILAQVSNGEGLLQWLGESHALTPDLVLSDLNMPGMNGMDIISALNAHPLWNDLPVIITSTSSTRSIIEKCLQAGAAAYVVKPDTFIHYEPYVRELHALVAERGLARPGRIGEPTGSEG